MGVHGGTPMRWGGRLQTIFWRDLSGNEPLAVGFAGTEPCPPLTKHPKGLEEEVQGGGTRLGGHPGTQQDLPAVIEPGAHQPVHTHGGEETQQVGDGSAGFSFLSRWPAKVNQLLR